MLKQWLQNRIADNGRSRRSSSTSSGSRSPAAEPEQVDMLTVYPHPLQPAPLLLGMRYYEPLGELGRGAFGLVVAARDRRNGGAVAIKLLPRTRPSSRVYLMREIMHHGSFWHPHIVALREVFLTPHFLAIVMEFAAGGDLFRYIQAVAPGGRLAEVDARHLFQQLVVGVQYCHGRGVANRDLKLENLLLSCPLGVPGHAAQLKIADFGYSKHELNSTAKTSVGTPIYMAPEVIFGGCQYNAKAADVWSMGVILYILLFGRYPFAPLQTPNAKRARLSTEDLAQHAYAQRLITGQYDIPAGVPVSESALHLLSRLLVPQPKQRAELGEVMAHPWFLHGLPEGALEMNDFYQLCAPDVAGLMPDIEAMVSLADSLGAPGEPLLACDFDGARNASIQAALRRRKEELASSVPPDAGSSSQELQVASSGNSFQTQLPDPERLSLLAKCGTN